MKINKVSLRVGLYSPYLDTLGGGERYMLTIAEYLSKENEVDILLDNHLNGLNIQQLIKQSAKRFDINLSKIRLVEAPLGSGSNLIKRGFFLKQYDFLFYLTDGSIFYSTAKNNIIHFQAPLVNKNKGLWGKKKLATWNLGICNSKFTQSIINQTWPIKTGVIYPPVDASKIKSLKKKNYILTVGRLLGYKKPKKHQILIETFKKIFDKKLISGWSLHIAGYISKDEIEELNEIKTSLKNYPIFFYPNYPFDKLTKLYGESKIYWHAAGFEEENPLDMEHFGITTVEAMAGGCVPVVINKGGQREIVEEDKNGFFWNNQDELIKKTLTVINDQKLFKKLSSHTIERSKLFTKEKFCHNIESIINGNF